MNLVFARSLLIAGVPEAAAAGPSSEILDFLQEEGSDEAMTPSRPRTTEDLFAAIHRYPKLIFSSPS